MKKIIFTIITLFVFTSSVNAYDLTISNLQDDSASNTYTYKLNVYKATGAYQYIYNNNESYIVFDATGNTTFTLQNNGNDYNKKLTWIIISNRTNSKQ